MLSGRRGHQTDLACVLCCAFANLMSLPLSHGLWSCCGAEEHASRLWICCLTTHTVLLPALRYGTRTVELLRRYYQGELADAGDDEELPDAAGPSAETWQQPGAGTDSRDHPAANGTAAGTGQRLQRERLQPRWAGLHVHAAMWCDATQRAL